MPTPIQHVHRGVDGLVKRVPAEVAALGPHDILVKITHSSLCGTDLAYIPYGIALGHEGIGVVEKVGSSVTQFKVGERAGGGYHRGSCGQCKYCLSGQDIWCYSRKVFGEGDWNNGTFADYYLGSETFLHKIPESLSSEDAAPLQCAGATVYSALIETVKANQRVGVIGIGGLGHLAIQFAKKLGAEVVAFSTSQSKEEEAKGFGADEFYILGEIGKMEEPVDVLVVAGNKQPDWEKFLVKNVLSRAGTIVPLCAPHSNLELPATPMFFDGYNIHSSLVASRGVHDDMLTFAARHGIKPKLERFPFTEAGLQEAVEKLKEGKIRYRGVLIAK